MTRSAAVRSVVLRLGLGPPDAYGAWHHGARRGVNNPRLLDARRRAVRSLGLIPAPRDGENSPWTGSRRRFSLRNEFRVRSAHAAAVVTWVYAAAFGLPVIPVVLILVQRQNLPTLLGLFQVYGGPWSSELSADSLIWLLVAFLVLCLLAAGSALLVWQGSRTGAVLNLALMPVEAVFWIGFALPGPVVLGVVRVMLLTLAWKSLRRPLG